MIPRAKAGTRGNRKQIAQPTWEEGYVDPQQEHFELRYGERQTPVARVGRDRERRVFVQFLDEKRDKNPRFHAIFGAVTGELTHYLFGAVGPDAWAFARFHCDTPANLASPVHWQWCPGA